MKLRTKISVIFAAALIINIFVVIFGLTFVLDSLSTRMMKKQAENITLFLQHRINSAMKDPDHGNALSTISADFTIAKHISDESKGFELKKILLIKPDYTVEAGYPENETGTSYAAHEDIREAFLGRSMETVDETNTDPDGRISKDIDVVSYFALADGSPRAIEVKLDFAESITLLEAQYTAIETGAIIIALTLLTGLLGVLLIIMGRTAVKPVIRVTHAMEEVGSGNLDISLPENSRDEFGLLAKRFNEMVSGLKEKFRLYNYVSQGTIDAVKGSLGGSGGHRTARKVLVLFFSDVRGFTTYSESRDPEAVISSLNKILSLQSDIINKFGGDVDKFVGDEVMAVFKDPAAAIDAALEIQKKMSEERHTFDDLHVGIGVHIGEVMQGDVGSADMRDYTVIGDNVNTAARLESVAGKDEILISENIAKNEKVRYSYLLKPRGELKLKGKEVAINTYLVTDRKS
ncbi:MAG TPA: adenylate/guanylate cyclase domain-containing protein [Spirochaetota bacterium]|nr:adenylate/guanylate cyclase domain-containing protein [Spirochaetota bacterium]